MATREAISAALTRAKAAADSQHAQIIYSAQLSRADRELLCATGWLQEIIRGWYMLVRPDTATGDTAAWYANFWDFIRIYLADRFHDDYCLSAESSLDLHIENPTIPQQVIVITKEGTGFRELMHATSLMIYENVKNFPEETTKKQGVRVMSLPLALCKITPTYFHNYPRNAELALRMLQTPTGLIHSIMRYNLKTAAARLIGAYQFLGDDSTAKEMSNTLSVLGIRVRPTNPFQRPAPLLKQSRIKSPYAGRIHAMWAEARKSVITYFPKPPGLPKNPEQYMHHIDEVYQYDAYNSLSIEGYHVTPELIERVKSDNWSPDTNEEDASSRDAMAARGYFDAFQTVKPCIKEIIHGGNAAQLVKENLQVWYQKLFGVGLQVGTLLPRDLLGYRNDQVFIRNSIHAPPPKEAVLDAMEAFFECLEEETHPAVRAVLGHYFFVFIHPYMDGNGRIGRFLMNTLLASGGYPWTVVRVDNRKKYIDTLEKTHMKFDMAPFTKFIAHEMAGSP